LRVIKRTQFLGVLPETGKASSVRVRYAQISPETATRVAKIGSVSCREDVKILRRDVCCPAGGDVMLVIEALQVPPQRYLASIGE